MRPMHELSWVLTSQSDELARIRDLLLPRLVTGRMDVSGLGALAETAEI